MPLPLMKEVFLAEASMRAWEMIGFSPRAKAAWEDFLGPDAFDVALYLLPTFWNPWWASAKVDRTDADRWLDGHERAIASARRALGSQKFRSELRKHAPQLSKLDTEKGTELIQGLVAQHPPEEPGEYGGRTALELEDGWRWVQVPEGECQDFEGTLMQHCGVAAGDMYSLRDPRGKPHATIEVVRNPAGADFGPLHYDQGVVQIKGKQNRPPDRRYWAMVKAFVDFIPAELRKIQEWDDDWGPLRAFLGQPIPDDLDPPEYA